MRVPVPVPVASGARRPGDNSAPCQSGVRDGVSASRGWMPACRYASGPSGYALRSVRAVTAGNRLVISNRASDARGGGNGGAFQSEVTVERVTVLGLTSQPKAVAVVNGASLAAWLAFSLFAKVACCVDHLSARTRYHGVVRRPAADVLPRHSNQRADGAQAWRGHHGGLGARDHAVDATIAI